MNMKDIRFKQFLLNESTAYLGQKVGAILTALQDINDNLDGMGARQVMRNAEGIVNQIRKVLHSDWNKRDEPVLKALQRSAVAIMKAIDEKDDLNDVLQGSASELEQALSNLGMPINQLGTPEGVEIPKENLRGGPKGNGTGDPIKPPKKQPQPPQPTQQPMPDQAGAATPPPPPGGM